MTISPLNCVLHCLINRVMKHKRDCREAKQITHFAMRSIKVFIAPIIAISFTLIILMVTNGKDSESTRSFNQIFNLEYRKSALKALPCCRWDENLLGGRLNVNEEDVDLNQVQKTDKILNDVRKGGRWSPKECTSKTKVAIIVPMRNREKHLKVLVRHLHPVLQRQRLDYRIFVISQVDRFPFNRAKLLNIGFNESMGYDDYECFVFHDVDLIPEDDRNDYGCPSGPRHMSSSINKFGYKLPTVRYFGGVVAFTKGDFLKINGFPNRYYGWGGEDDDIYYRVLERKMKIFRPPLEIGRYTMIMHKDEQRNDKRFEVLSNCTSYIDTDGVNTLRYKVEAARSLDLYTQIEVNVEITDEEKRLTSLKEMN